LAGSYDPQNVILTGPLQILDVGANVGAFSLWAAGKWPQATITAYEPHPDNRTYFKANTGHINRITLIDKAVSTQNPMELFISKKYCTTHSSRPVYREAFEEVPLKVEAIHPNNLPYCDILKLDVEGGEVEIVDCYLNFYKPRLILVETHSVEDRHAMERLCADYFLVEGEITGQTLATLKFVHKSVTQYGEGG
jgi:FkbM family methyltransferase